MENQGLTPDLIHNHNQTQGTSEGNNYSSFDLVKTDYFPRINHSNENSTSESSNYLYEESKVRAFKKEEKIKKIEQEEKKARQFKANSVPKWVGLLPYKASNKTKENKPSPFKARNVPNSLRTPFEPLHVNKFTLPKSPKLATQQRVEEREEFERVKRQRDIQLEQARKEAEELKKKNDEAEIQKIRKNAQFIAKPMPSFKSAFNVKKSIKPLTVPRSPSLCTSNIGPSPSSKKRYPD